MGHVFCRVGSPGISVPTELFVFTHFWPVFSSHSMNSSFLKQPVLKHPVLLCITATPGWEPGKRSCRCLKADSIRLSGFVPLVHPVVSLPVWQMFLPPICCHLERSAGLLESCWATDPHFCLMIAPLILLLCFLLSCQAHGFHGPVG